MSKSKLPYLFVLPTLVVLLLYSYLPVTYGIYLSFHHIIPGTGAMSFAGLSNYKDILTNPYFFESLGNTIFYLCVSTIIIIGFSLIVALVLNTKIRFSSFYLTVMFVPWVLSDVVVGNTWQWLLNPDFGVLKFLFAPFGWDVSVLITRPKFALWGVVIVTLWKMMAYNTLLLLAGLQNLSNDYIEAARLDGCNGLQILRYVTLPILTPTILTVALLSIINCINQTGIILVLTNGGPLRSTETLALYLYKEAFLNFNLNNATALSMVLAVINILIVVLYIRLTAKKTVEV